MRRAPCSVNRVRELFGACTMTVRLLDTSRTSLPLEQSHNFSLEQRTVSSRAQVFLLLSSLFSLSSLAHLQNANNDPLRSRTVRRNVQNETPTLIASRSVTHRTVLERRGVRDSTFLRQARFVLFRVSSRCVELDATVLEFEL